jgi:hypothetical protein
MSKRIKYNDLFLLALVLVKYHERHGVCRKIVYKHLQTNMLPSGYRMIPRQKVTEINKQGTAGKLFS